MAKPRNPGRRKYLTPTSRSQLIIPTTDSSQHGQLQHAHERRHLPSTQRLLARALA